MVVVVSEKAQKPSSKTAVKSKWLRLVSIVSLTEKVTIATYLTVNNGTFTGVARSPGRVPFYPGPLRNESLHLHRVLGDTLVVPEEDLQLKRTAAREVML